MPRIEMILTVLVWLAVIGLFVRFWRLADREQAEKARSLRAGEKSPESNL